MANGTRFMDYIANCAVQGTDPELVFWGRYIGGQYSVTAAEAASLHANGINLLVIYNGATPARRPRWSRQRPRRCDQSASSSWPVGTAGRSRYFRGR